VQPKAKAHLREIWQADTRKSANKAFHHFLEKYQSKYQTAWHCMKRNQEVLLSFSLRLPRRGLGASRRAPTIESTFATIRLRHRRTGNGTRKASLTMMFKLAQAAQQRWRRLNKHELILLLIQGKVFKMESCRTPLNPHNIDTYPAARRNTRNE
jgi:putative transposase